MPGERTIRIKFDGSSAGLVAAAAASKAAIKDLADDSTKRSQAFTDLSTKMQGMLTGFGSLVSGASNIGTAISALPAAVATVGTLAGVAPLAVAGILGMAGAFGALKLGSDGIKKAFSALTPEVNTLKAAVSKSFEQGMAPAVKNLQAVLPKTTVGFKEIATAISGVATKVTSYIASAKGTSEVNTILDGSARLIQNLGKFIAPVIAAFIQIGAVAMPILDKLTSHIGVAGQGFQAFISRVADSGQLAAWINNAIALFDKIFHSIARGAELASAVFSPLLGAGQSAAGGLSAAFSLLGLKMGGIPGLIIGTIIPALSAFSKTPAGIQTMQDLAKAFTTVSNVVTGVLTKAFQVLAPLIDPLARLFTNVVTVVGSMLTPALSFLAPIIQNIANFISQNLQWLTPLVVGIGLWTAAQWLLNIALDANPIGLVILAVAALIAIVATIITYWTPISGFFVMLWGVVTNAFNVFIDWVKTRFSEAVDWVVGVWGHITSFFSTVWGGITGGVSTAMQWVKDRFSDAVNWVKSVWGNITGFFSGLWSGIGNGLKAALNGVIRLVNGAINGLNHVTGLVGIPGIPNIPYLAKGGTATAGRSYVVGEKGPELFTPGQTGRVTSNAQSFGRAQEINLNLDLGEGIQQRVQISIDQNNRATWRTVKAGSRAA